MGRSFDLLMHRIQRIRKQDQADRRSRWWRDGLVCALVGAFSGLVATMIHQTGSFWLVPTISVAAGVLGACFGDRVLMMLHC